MPNYQEPNSYQSDILNLFLCGYPLAQPHTNTNKDEYETIKLKAQLLGMLMSRFIAEKAKNSYVEGYTKAKAEKEEEKRLKQIEGQMKIF